MDEKCSKKIKSSIRFLISIEIIMSNGKKKMLVNEKEPTQDGSASSSN